MELENNSLLYRFQKNKLRINLTKVQNLYSENYQTTMKEIKELDKFASISCSQTGRLFTEGSWVQFSRVRLFATPWIAARQASLSITNSRSLLKLMPMSRWCHPAISSSVALFSSCPQSLQASGSFPVSQETAALSKLIYRFNATLIKIPMTFFA